MEPIVVIRAAVWLRTGQSFEARSKYCCPEQRSALDLARKSRELTAGRAARPAIYTLAGITPSHQRSSPQMELRRQLPTGFRS